MRRWIVAMTIAALAAVAQAGDLESTLSPDRPADQAILSYLALAKAKTASAADLTELGVLLARTARLADAERWLRQAVKKDRHSFAAWYRLGLVRQQLGRSHDAAQTFARALRERPDDPYARFMLALAEERSGRKSAAVKSYVRAYDVMPALADPRTNPLVLDSSVQVQANLRHYRQTVTAGTMPVLSVDPEAVRAMLATRPAPTAPDAGPSATPEPAPQPPLPEAETIPVPAPAPKPPPPAQQAPAPGSPGGPDPRLKPPTS